ncbi:MAG: ACP S-malonyltransferase [Dehalococcoidia bacterium]|nr:ACP S-malonyltransferase [Dehalococcoidia bacterium]MDW8120247.1 ACP S-malonyltransferase [Chloroflexota bacterium]
MSQGLTPAPFAFLFPGQGTQFVGMGRDLAEASPAARALFQQADEALGFPLSRLMFEGPQADLTRTDNAQPAILVASLACLAALEEVVGKGALPPPAYAAGHSLGEYTALVAARSLTVEDAVRLVRLRGRLMQEASERCPGTMVVVLGLDEMTVEEVCRETGAQISTVNTEEQIVIAGDHLAVARAADLCALRGARRLVPLQVAGAFHTTLMASAREGLAQALAQVPIRDPQVPIVANASARPITTAQEVRQELVEQLCAPVRWKHSMQFLLSRGIKTFVELGPGRVLSGMLRQMSREVRLLPIADARSLAGVTAPWW